MRDFGERRGASEDQGRVRDLARDVEHKAEDVLLDSARSTTASTRAWRARRRPRDSYAERADNIAGHVNFEAGTELYERYYVG